METNRSMKVLFLSDRNCGRSLMAEAILGAVGTGRFQAYSAGITPGANPHPIAIDLLDRNRLPVDRLRPKEWQRFVAPGLLELDFVISVCEQDPASLAASWPGNPLLVHWSMPDPEADAGGEAELRRAMFTAYNRLYHRLMILVSLPLDKYDRVQIKQRLDEIGGRESVAA